MRKITSMFIILVFLASLISVSADNLITTDAELEQETQAVIESEITEDPELADVGTTPDQAGYGLKLALERVRLALTFNDAKKADLSLRLAELRLKEARLMAAENKLEHMDRLRIEHKKYLEIAESNFDDSEASVETQVQFESNIQDQVSQVNEIESIVLLKARGLTEDQKARLLALIEEFRSQNQNLELKIESRRDVLKTRLKAKGLNDDEIEIEIEQEFEDEGDDDREGTSEDRALHQVNQAQKMYDLASRLINKYQNFVSNNTNSTANTSLSTTLELHTKAKVKLDEARANLAEQLYAKAILSARQSKRISALTIASIHGNFRSDMIEDRLDKIEDLREKLEDRRGKSEDKRACIKEGQITFENELARVNVPLNMRCCSDLVATLDNETGKYICVDLDNDDNDNDDGDNDNDDNDNDDEDNDECEIEDCGPALGMPNYLCGDGRTGGPTGRCFRSSDNRCGWEVITCTPRS